MLVFGLCKMEPSLSSLENMLLGFLLFLHSFAHLSFAVSVLDFLHLGFSLSVRQLGRMGFPFLTFGRCQAASSSSAVDLSPSDFSLSLQSSSQLDPVLLVFDLLHPDFMFLLHQLACFELASSTSDKFQVDSPSPASDFTLLGSLALFRNPGCPGSLLLLFGKAQLGSLTPLSDYVTLDFVISLHSSCCTDSVSLPVDLAHSELLTFLRSHTRLGFASSALDLLHLEFFLPLHSPAWLGHHVSLVDFTHVGSPSFVRSLT